MKKILSVFIAVLVLFSCFSITAFAYKDITIKPPGYEEEEIPPLNLDAIVTLSDDYKTLYWGEETYKCFNPEGVYYDPYHGFSDIVTLTKAQEEEVDNVELFVTTIGEMVEGAIYFKDGSMLKVNYFKTDYIKEYKRMAKSNFEERYILFNYSYDYDDSQELTLKTTQTLLKGEKVNLKVSETKLKDYFDIACKSPKLNFLVMQGVLFDYDNEYYYIDYKEFGLNESDFSAWNYEGPAYKITDDKLIKEIDEKLIKYYQEDYGIFLNDEFTKTVSNVFIIIIFAIIPFAILVLGILFGIKAKKLYRKFFFITAALSAAELITLAIILLIS